MSPLAPELRTSAWFPADRPLTLRQLRGRVVVIEAFQMLCPGCVSHGLPQARRVADTFSTDDVVVLGLHCVFEHHDVQGRPEALEAFLHEYRIGFPVALDAASEGRIPQTMAAYELRGTPTILLIDREGRLRKKAFGAVSDLELGAEIATLVQEPYREVPEDSVPDRESPGEVRGGCSEDRCEVLPRT